MVDGILTDIESNCRDAYVCTTPFTCTSGIPEGGDHTGSLCWHGNLLLHILLILWSNHSARRPWNLEHALEHVIYIGCCRDDLKQFK